MAITIDNYKNNLPIIRENYDSLYSSGEEIIFELNDKRLIYKARKRYIACQNDSNDSIFRELRVNKYNFCEKAYGHRPNDGGCPETVINNSSGIYNLVKMIFEEIENRGLYKPIMKLELENVKTNIINNNKDLEDIINTSSSTISTTLYNFLQNELF